MNEKDDNYKMSQEDKKKSERLMRQLIEDGTVMVFNEDGKLVS